MVSIFFRSISYITIFLAENKSLFNYLFNFKGLFINSELNNEIYINYVSNNFYLTNFCNEYLLNTFLNDQIKFFEPQPLVMRFLFEEGLLVLSLFLMYIFINIKKILNLLFIKIWYYLF